MSCKRCPKCQQSKDTCLFFKNKSMPDGLSGWCKSCHTKHTKPYSNKDKLNGPNGYRSLWKSKNLSASLLANAKVSAKRKGLFFDLTIEDIVIPAICPVLGIPLFRTPGIRTANTPSIDRINNSIGYIKGNISIISWRANQLKNNASMAELEALLNYMRTA